MYTYQTYINILKLNIERDNDPIGELKMLNSASISKAIQSLGFDMDITKGVSVLDNNHGLDNKLSITGINKDGKSECIVFSTSTEGNSSAIVVFITVPSDIEIMSVTKYGFAKRKNGYVGRINSQDLLISDSGKIVRVLGKIK